MTTRIRTMHRQGPVASRRASSPPNTPNEGITHPAGYQDPGPDDYNIGGPSDFGEDVHPPPYRTSGPPHLPEDDGGYRHPAAQPGAPMKNAALRKWANHRAVLCTKLARHFVGSEIAAAAEAGDDRALDMLERQASIFMDLSDDQLRESMINYKSAALPVHKLARALLAGEDAEEEDTEDDDSEKKENPFAKKEAALLRAAKAAYRQRFAADEEEEEPEEETEDDDSEEAEETASKKASAAARLRRDIKLARRLIAEAKADGDDVVEEAKKEVEEAKKEASRRAKAKKSAASRRAAEEEKAESEKAVSEAKEAEADLEKTAGRLRRIAKTAKYASSVRRAAGERLAEVMMALDDLKAKISEMEVGGRYSSDEDMGVMGGEDDVDALLAEMEAEEAAGQYMGDDEMDEEAMLAQMMAEQESGVEASDSMPEDTATLSQMMAEDAAPEGGAVACGDDIMADDGMGMVDDMSYFDEGGFDVGMDPLDDPLGDISGMEDPMLASIFASSPSMAVPGQPPVDLSNLSRQAGMNRSASARPARPAAAGSAPALRPQLKKPSVGVGKVGTQVRTAAANNDDELSKLWSSPPDINGFFSR